MQVQLAQHGPGSCSMPKVSAPMVRVKEDPGTDHEEEDEEEQEDTDNDMN